MSETEKAKIITLKPATFQEAEPQAETGQQTQVPGEDEDPALRQPVIEVDKEKEEYVSTLVNDASKVKAGSPLKLDYNDSTVLMYKTLKNVPDMNVNDVMERDHTVADDNTIRDKADIDKKKRAGRKNFE